MLMLTLPNGEKNGDCKINGEPCEYKIEGDRLGYRPKGSEEFDTRTIIHTTRGPKLTTYYCTAQDGGGIVIAPAVFV
jgi:hypothetical protein